MKTYMNLSVVITLLLMNLTSKAQVCFVTQPAVVNTAADSYHLCQADFNGDGKMDLATPNANGTVSILLGNGTGGFSSITNDSVSNYEQTICTADFNNDGKADLATYNSGPAEGSILLGDGLGNFTISSVNLTGIFSPASGLIASDFNNDGKVDLALSSSYYYVVVALGNGDGTFGTATNIPATSSIVGELAVSDFNNDGKKDIASIGNVLLGNGLGGFTSSYIFTDTNHPRAFTIADFNNDGKQDIVTANWGIGTSTGYVGSVTTYLGDGAGSFTASVDYSLGDSAVPFNPRYEVCSGDFNGDAKLDIAIGTWKTHVGVNVSRVSILLGDGLGGFGLPIEFSIPNYPKAILKTDLNNDGKQDLAILGRNITGNAIVEVLLGCSPSGLNEAEDLSNSISIFPNPSQGNIAIQSENVLEEINVLNIQGQIVSTWKPNSNYTSLHINQQGFYILQILSNTQTILKKVMIE